MVKDKSVIWSGRGYCKVILHLAKYPHCAINGLLLGVATDKSIIIQDVIPLFHQSLHLSPMIEVALTQVDAMAQNAGLSIIGYYVATETIAKPEDTVDTVPGAKIAEKIAEYFPQALFVINDNAKFIDNGMSAHFNVSQYHDGKWKPKDSNLVLIEDGVEKSLKMLINHRAEKQLVDFDNHLDDITQDWSNQELNKQIDQLIY